MPPHCMERFYGVEEMLWDHFQMRMSHLYQFYLAFAAVCFGFAAWAANKELPVHENNFVEFLEPLLQARSKWTNGTIYMGEIVASLEPTHPLYLLYNRTQIRYEFGSTYYNFCELKVQPHHSLPSLLRVMEMKIMPQACLRAVVLVGLLLKFVLCMAQAKVDYMHSSRRTIFLILSRVSPFLQLTSTSVLMFIVCLQQDQDKDSGWIMHIYVPLFSVLFLAHASVYSFLEVAKQRRNVDVAIFILRAVALTAFAFAAPSVYESHLAYLSLKPCHTHVSISAAVSEYLCICVITLFSISQICDYKGLLMNLVAVPCDTIPRQDLPHYTPVFITSLYDSAPFAHLRRRDIHVHDLKCPSA